MRISNGSPTKEWLEPAFGDSIPQPVATLHSFWSGELAAFSDLWQPHAKVISGARRKSTDPTDGNLHILKPISALTT